MQLVNKELVEILSKAIDLPEPIYEFGSFRVEGQEEFADLRPFFPNKEYIGCDARQGLGVDKVLDIHSIDVATNSVGSIICIDTFEHVEFFWKGMEEFHRILKEDGVLLLTSVMKFPIHDHPSDYWRFTPEALKSLTKQFKTRIVCSIGEPDFPTVVSAICFKSSLDPLKESRLRLKLDGWKMKWDKKNIRDHYIQQVKDLAKNILFLLSRR